MTFEQEIIKVLVDNGLLALLVVVGGFVLDRYLEKYKSNEVMRNEIIKMRLNAMNEVWSELNVNLIKILQDSRKPEFSLDGVTTVMFQIGISIEKNRLQCGNKFTNEIVDIWGGFSRYYSEYNPEQLGDDTYKALTDRMQKIVDNLNDYAEWKKIKV